MTYRIAEAADAVGVPATTLRYSHLVKDRHDDVLAILNRSTTNPSQDGARASLVPVRRRNGA